MKACVICYNAPAPLPWRVAPTAELRGLWKEMKFAGAETSNPIMHLCRTCHDVSFAGLTEPTQRLAMVRFVGETVNRVLTRVTREHLAK